MERDHTYKEEKYSPLVADHSSEYQVYQFSVEVSARGFISRENKARIKAFSLKCCEARNAEIQNLIKMCSKTALLTSFSIFSARNEPSWSSPLPLLVRS